MNVEHRLREALEAEASAVHADPQAWERVVAELRTTSARGHGWRTAGVAVSAAAAVIAAAVGLWAVRDVDSDDAQVVDVGPPTTEVPAPPATTVPAPAPSPPAVEPWPGIWPFASQQAADAYVGDPGVGLFFDAEATALEFARAYLGMLDPVTTSGFVADGDGSSGGVAVLSAPDAPTVLLTRISVERVGADGPYVVVGAEAAPNIGVDRPAAGDRISSPADLAGESSSFEGAVNVEVRQDGQAFGEALGTSSVTGSGGPTPGPFAGTVSFDAPTEPSGAVVFAILSAKDGTVTQATVVRVHFADAATTRFSVYFHRGEELVAFPRQVPATQGVLRAALESLFAGPQPADGADVASFFSAETADLLRDVTITPDGTAVVDLERTVENASTSAGSAVFGRQIAATVFQFPTVQRLELRLQGSCEAFTEWMQGDGCQVVSR